MPEIPPFRRLLARLGRSADPIRVGYSDNQIFKSTYVDSAHLDRVIDHLRDTGMNVWFEVNPSLYDAEQGRSSAQHITRLAAVWADLDFKDSGLGSEDGAFQVIDDLSAALGVQPAVIVHSGNGLQPYWPVLNGQITTENRDDVALLLRRWGAFVKRVAENNGGTADSVFDLPRVLRVPGPPNMKQREQPKPTRADFQDTPDLELDEIRQVLDDYEVVVDTVEIATERVSPAAEWEWAAEDCEFVGTALREITDSNPAARHQWALKWSGIIYGMIRSGCVTEEGHERLRAALVGRFQSLLDGGAARPFSPREMEGIFKEGLKMAESWSKNKLALEMRSHVHRGFVEAFLPEPVRPSPILDGSPAPEPQLASTPGNVSSIFTKQPIVVAPAAGAPLELGALALQMSETAQQRLSSARYTDIGNAERLGQWLQGRFLFVPDMGWLRWNGNRWVSDASGSVVEATKDMFVSMAATAGDDTVREWALKSMSISKLNATMKLAQTVPHLVLSPAKLDSNAYELNTPAGVMDLRTSSLRAPNPMTDFHTQQTAFAPERMDTPRFIDFLMWAMQGDVEMIAYLQRIFGLALIGQLVHHVFPIFTGSGANGKTTMLELMVACMGSYGTVLPPKFLVEKRSESHPTDIADLRGVRLAAASEVPPTAAFDEERVKQLTGESRLKARFMGKDFFEFENSATLVLAANHLPAVRVGGTGFWRRVRKIEFNSMMPLHRQNPNLPRELLAAEGPGILQWMIDGAQAVQKMGLADPGKVMVATRDYQLEEDSIARFILSELVADESAEGIETSREVVYARYREWTFRMGGNPLGAMKFARELTTALPQAKLGSSDVFTNLRVRTLEPAPSGWPAA